MTVGAIVLIVLLGGGAAAWAATSSGNSGYRMATVTRADIGQSMTIVGTVEPVNDASASFQVAGQVATVTATVGQQVTAGQSLGTLDTTSLSESVSSAQSTLNSDEAKLAQDESSQSSSTSSTPSASSTSTTTTTTTSSSKGGSSTGSQSTITQDQNTLTQDEAQTGTDQQKVAADLAHAQQACGTGTTTTTSSTTTTTTNPANCEAALAQVSKDQQQVSADQAAVAKDEAALSQALNQGSSSTSGSPTSTSGSPTQTSRALSSTPSGVTGNSGSGTGSGSGGGGSGSSGGTGSSASGDTPQQIAADQAAIDTAQAELTVAGQSLAEANLTSPINGTIVSVGINVGDTVSANSSTDVIVIIGTQSFEVSGTLSSSQVPSIKVGDSAGAQVDGIDGTIDGTVSQVGPVQSGTSGYTYPVVVALPSSATGLFTGSTANVVIATGAVADVVAVPTSAVQSLGSRSYVEMLSNGTLTRKVIKVGMVGNTYSQVLSGLMPGQSVVLADYAEPVPSSNTNTFGGFGGGGFGGGGFGGGAGFRISRTAGGGGAAGGFGGG